MNVAALTLRILGGLIGTLMLLVGLLGFADGRWALASSQLILGTLFLSYGFAGNIGYRRLIRVAALPVGVPLAATLLVWLGYDLWSAARDGELSKMAGEGSIHLKSRPIFFSVIVVAKLIIIGACLRVLMLALRLGKQWLGARH